jgi:hypothetical protein
MKPFYVTSSQIQPLEKEGEFLVRVRQPRGEAFTQELDYATASLVAAIFRPQLETELVPAAAWRRHVIAELAAGRLVAGSLRLHLHCQSGQCRCSHIGIAHPAGELGKQGPAETPDVVVGGFPLLDQAPPEARDREPGVTSQEPAAESVRFPPGIDLAKAEARLEAQEVAEAAQRPAWLLVAGSWLLAVLIRWLVRPRRLRVVRVQEATA